MNKRLQQFLELENLTPARLADILGVQRSGMSHILSGRNKPGYDFILKLLTKFPELSADWFITGKGKPYKKADSYPAAPAEIEASDLFNTAKMSDEENENENVYPANDENSAHIIDNKDVTSQIRLPQRDENEKIGNSIPSMGKIRKIKRITIFYDDGSFEEFYK